MRKLTPPVLLLVLIALGVGACCSGMSRETRAMLAGRPVDPPADIPTTPPPPPPPPKLTGCDPVEEACRMSTEAQLANARRLYDTLVAVEIPAPDVPRAFKDGIVLKTNAARLAQQAFLDIVRTGARPSHYEAFAGAAGCDIELVRAIRTVPPPRGLTAEQAQLFLLKLEEQTLPLIENAAHTYEQCVRQAQERHDAPADWLEVCERGVRELRAR